MFSVEGGQVFWITMLKIFDEAGPGCRVDCRSLLEPVNADKVTESDLRPVSHPRESSALRLI